MSAMEPQFVNNSSFDEWQPTYQKIRDAYAGQRKIHEGGTTYLPQLSGQSSEDYEAYKKRATFFNAFGKTVKALTSMVFTKDIEVTAPDLMEPVLENITLSGISLRQLSERMLNEVLQITRYGMLVEYPAVPDDMSLTQAQREQMNLRPYIVDFLAEDIRDWAESYHPTYGKRLSMVELSQTLVYKAPYTEYKDISATEVRRLLYLDENDHYKQKMWFSNLDADGKNIDTGYEEFTPLMNGQPMRYIPFFFFDGVENTSSIKQPHLLDLVELNLAHYRMTADYNWGLHYVALPTPVISGVDAGSNTSYRIGPAEAWVFTDPNAKAFYLEFTGSGMSAISKALAETESQMTVMGSRSMLSTQQRAAETAQTEIVRRNAENSYLASIVNSCEEQLEKVLNTMRDWMGLDGEVEVSFNKDFLAYRQTGDYVRSITEAVEKGVITQETGIQTLKEGNVLPQDIEAEDEADATESGDAGTKATETTIEAE
jgi:hypothetical protein